ncbi:hypothetical protein CK203_089180 [Vitis vinifera]|uniref:DUF4378 domain-containing protein n=1 Tax=Vitis vinifera TaxID=29760 RepID=A0A438EK75_VITVI|nr:hypothetical protein CK203_089180 [Vitis vinifera]
MDQRGRAVVANPVTEGLWLFAVKLKMASGVVLKGDAPLTPRLLHCFFSSHFHALKIRSPSFSRTTWQTDVANSSDPYPRPVYNSRNENPSQKPRAFPEISVKMHAFSPSTTRRTSKVPLWSPAKSPRKNSNAIFLHIPARTAAMLLEAALRIQKQSSPKPKAQNKNVGFGIFGSIMKRLTQRNRNRKREIEGDGLRVSVKDILRWDSSVGRKKLTEEFKNVSEEMVGVEEKSASEMGFSCSCNGRLSSVWSESNEEKSLDMETSSSSQSEVSAEIIDFVSKERQNGDFASCEKDFCTSPFRFVLQRSPSSGRHTPNFSSPATSPSRHRSQDKENNYEGESLIEEEEEEKEQFSPVSILDPPSKTTMMDTKEMMMMMMVMMMAVLILNAATPLYRIEKLAELDPIELEKRMLEGLDDDNNDAAQWDAESEDCGIPQDMKRLVSDLIAQEEREQQCSRSREVVVERVCKRLESWTEVESNTIDMMVELDFRRELSGWSKNQEQVDEAAIEIELAIFGLLVEEVSEELVCLKGI